MVLVMDTPITVIQNLMYSLSPFIGEGDYGKCQEKNKWLLVDLNTFGEHIMTWNKVNWIHWTIWAVWDGNIWYNICQICSCLLSNFSLSFYNMSLVFSSYWVVRKKTEVTHVLLISLVRWRSGLFRGLSALSKVSPTISSTRGHRTKWLSSQPLSYSASFVVLIKRNQSLCNRKAMREK